MQGIITVTIHNWKKYNYRIDLKKPSWFRFENSFFEEPDLYSLNIEEIAVFVYLLCLASKKNDETISINKDHAKLVGRIPEKILLSSISKLEVLGKIRHVDVTPPLRERHVDGIYITDRHDKQDMTNKHDQNKFDLESLYFQYPRKIGKKKGIEKLKVLIKGQETFDAVKKSILNYAEYCSKHINEPKYIKHFSSFVGTWEDWLEPKTESITAKTLGPKPLKPPSGIPEELTRPDPRVGPLAPDVKKLLDQALGKL